MRNFLLSLCFCSMPFPIFLQEQLSEIDIPIDDFQGNIIVAEVDSIEYLLLEDCLYSTQVYEIGKDSIHFMHDYNFMHTFEGIRTVDYADLKDSVIYKVHESEILAINYLSADLRHQVNLHPSGVRRIEDFSVHENIYLFTAIRDEERKYFKYNIESNSLESIPFTEEGTTYRSNHLLYRINDEETQIQSFDVITNEQQDLLADGDGFQQLIHFYSKGIPHILAFTSEGRYYHIGDDNLVNEVGCLTTETGDLSGVYISDNIITYYVDELKGRRLISQNISTCEILIDENIEQGSFSFFDVPSVASEYLFFGIDQTPFIIDFNTNQLFMLPNFPLDILEDSRRVADRLYGSKTYHLSGGGYSLVFGEIDLINKSYRELNNDDDFPYTYYSQYIDLLGSRKDKNLSYIYDNGDRLFLRNYRYETDSHHLIFDFTAAKNYGLSFFSNLYRYSDNTLLVQDDKSLNLINGTETMTIEQPTRQSHVVFHNDHGHILLNEDEETFHLKINMTDGSLEKSKIGTLQLAYPFRSTKHLIIVNSNIFGSNKGYFDVRTESFSQFSFQNNPVTPDVSNFTISGERIIFKAAFPDNTFYWFNTETLEMQELNHLAVNEFIFPDNLGAFYYINRSENTIEKITSPDSISPALVLPEFTIYTYDDNIGLSGNYPAFLLPGEDNTLIVHEVGGIIDYTSIPNEGTVYYRTPVYQKFGQHMVIETNVNDRKHLFYLKLGEEPIDLTPDGYDKLIRKIIVNDEHATIFYSDINNSSEMTIEKFNLLNHSLESSESLDFKSYVLTDETYQLGETNYIMVGDDFYSGSELWHYDIENNSLKLLSDIITGPKSSSPRSFYTSENYIYFTAITTDCTRQLFRISRLITSTHDEGMVIEEVPDQNLFPNPNHGSLYFKKSVASIEIVDVLGKPILQRRFKEPSEFLDISALPRGLYFMVMTDEKGKTWSESFYKY